MNRTSTDSSTPEFQGNDTLLLQLDEYLTSPTLSEDDDPLFYWKDNCHHFPELSKWHVDTYKLQHPEVK